MTSRTPLLAWAAMAAEPKMVALNISIGSGGGRSKAQADVGPDTDGPDLPPRPPRVDGDLKPTLMTSSAPEGPASNAVRLGCGSPHEPQGAQVQSGRDGRVPVWEEMGVAQPQPGAGSTSYLGWISPHLRQTVNQPMERENHGVFFCGRHTELPIHT